MMSFLPAIASSSSPVNGGFGAYFNVGSCSVACGTGVQNQRRNCDNPAPANGGSNCVGAFTRTVTCTRDPCSETMFKSKGFVYCYLISSH